MRKFRKLENNEATTSLNLPSVACSLSYITTTNVTLAAGEMEDFEICDGTVMEVASCLDWWMVAVQGLAYFTEINDMMKVHLWSSGGGVPH